MKTNKIFLSGFICLIVLFGCQKDNSLTANSNSDGSTGIGGSLARFTVANNHLYAVNKQSLKIFDVTSTENPVFVTDVNLGLGIETIFPYNDKLFIGSQTGMQIYDNSNPSNPKHLSTYAHIQSCDPVVADSNYAYVTLRSGSPCRNSSTNQLEVIDISNLNNPISIETYSLNNPYGLGIDDTLLFVCDGNAGLKVYDIRDKYNFVLLSQVTDINPIDVIPYHNNLMLIASDGLYQYDYSDPRNLKKYTQIAVLSKR